MGSLFSIASLERLGNLDYPWLRLMGRHGPITHAILVTLFFTIFQFCAFHHIFDGNLIFNGSDALGVVVPSFLAPFKLWSQEVFGGFPIAAELQVFSFNPFVQGLKFFLDPFVAFNSFYFLTFILFPIFMYGYIFFLTGRKLAAFLAAIAIASSGFISSHADDHIHLIHAGIWFPLILWGIEKIKEEVEQKKSSCFGIIMVSLGVAFAALGGHPQLFSYVFYFSFFYLVYRTFFLTEKRFYFLIFALLAMGLGILLSAIQIIPTLELSTFAGRGSGNYERFTSWPVPIRSVVGLIFPYYHVLYEFKIPFFALRSPRESVGYICGFGFLLAAVVLFSKNRKLVQIGSFFVVVALVAIVLTFGESPLAKVFYNLPFYGKFRVISRHFFLYDFSICVLIGLGVAAIQAGCISWKKLKRAIQFFGILLFAVMLLALVIYPEIRELGISTRDFDIAASPWVFVNLSYGIALVILLGCCFFLVHRQKRTLLLMLLSLIIVGDSLAYKVLAWRTGKISHLAKQNYANQDVAVEKFKDLLLKSNHRYVTGDGANSMLFGPNLSRAQGIPSGSGHLSLIPRNYVGFTGIGHTGLPPLSFYRDKSFAADLMAIRFVSFINNDNLNIAEFEKEKQHLIGSARWKFFSEEFAGVVPDRHSYFIFENQRVMDRAWIAKELVPMNDIGYIWLIVNGLHSRWPVGRFDPKKQSIVHERDFPELKALQNGEGEVKVMSIEDTEVVLSVDAKKPSLLVLADVFYTGWEASVRGSKEKIFEINGLLRGVKVPTGLSEVRFTFRPMSIYVGALVTLMALLVLFLLVFFNKIRSFLRKGF